MLMGSLSNGPTRGLPWMFVIFFLMASGCSVSQSHCLPPDTPRESNKFSVPDYVIAPPDVLLIDAVRLVPRPPYKIAPLDALLIRVAVVGASKEVSDLRPGQPIAGLYRVEPDGVVSLGFEYGSVFVAGQTIPEARETIKKYLKEQQNFTVDFSIQVNLAESRAMQLIRGEHLVRPDGQVTLGSYGSVFIAGMTLAQAKKAIQDFLSSKLLEPEISLDVAGFNSMVYYVIFDLDGSGQSVKRLPFTGNETVLDAVANLNGLPPGSDRFRIWIARPNAEDESCDQILPVDWQAITKKGRPSTNYQLLPGDRLYVAVDPFVAADGFLAKVIAPIERIFGIILLGNSSVQSFHNNGGTGGGI